MWQTSRRYSATSKPLLPSMRMSSKRQFGTVLARQQDGVVAVVGVDDLVAGLRQAVRHRGQHQAVVVDDQDLALGIHGGGVGGGSQWRAVAGHPFAHNQSRRAAPCGLRLGARCTLGGPSRTRSAPRRPAGQRQSGAAPRQQRAHQAQAGHAAGKLRQAEALAQPPGVADAQRTSSPCSDSAQRTSPCAPCLTALVSSSLMVSAIGIDSASGSSIRPGSLAVELHLAPRGRRCAAPTPRSPRQHAGHAQRPAGADLQPVDLRDGLHLADRFGQDRRHLGVARGVLLQQPGHALQVVLDAVVHFLDQHLALRDRRLEARLRLGPLLGHVAGHQQHLLARRRRCWAATRSACPSARAGRPSRCISRRSTSFDGRRRAQVGTQRPCRHGAEPVRAACCPSSSAAAGRRRPRPSG